MSERDCFCGAEDCGECATHQSCDRALADLRDRWENLEAFIVSRTPAGGAGPTADPRRQGDADERGRRSP
jgi:hypothetical protein